MTNISIFAETAAKRKYEAIKAARQGDYNEAAKCFLYAAEMYAKDGNEIGELEMKEASGVYQRKRDQQKGLTA